MIVKVIYLIILLFIIVTFGIIKPYYKEPLKNKGHPTIEMKTAPLAYENTTLFLKNPDYYNNITLDFDNSFDEILFNNNDYKKLYRSSEMNMDFKYFNNASNLDLFQSHNVSGGNTFLDEKIKDIIKDEIIDLSYMNDINKNKQEGIDYCINFINDASNSVSDFKEMWDKNADSYFNNDISYNSPFYEKVENIINYDFEYLKEKLYLIYDI